MRCQEPNVDGRNRCPRSGQIKGRRPRSLDLAHHSLVGIDTTATTATIICPRSALTTDIPTTAPTPRVVPLALGIGNGARRLRISAQAALLSTLHRGLRLVNAGGNYSRKRYKTYAILIGNHELGTYLALTIVRRKTRVAAVRNLNSPSGLRPVRTTFVGRSNFRYNCYASKRVYSSMTILGRVRSNVPDRIAISLISTPRAATSRVHRHVDNGVYHYNTCTGVLTTVRSTTKRVGS